MVLQLSSELLNRKNLQGNLVVEKLDSLMVLAFLHLESCQNSGRLAEVIPSMKYKITHIIAHMRAHNIF